MGVIRKLLDAAQAGLLGPEGDPRRKKVDEELAELGDQQPPPPPSRGEFAVGFLFVVLGRAGVFAGLPMAWFAGPHLDDGVSGPWALLAAALAVSMAGAWVAAHGAERAGWRPAAGADPQK